MVHVTGLGHADHGMQQRYPIHLFGSARVSSSWTRCSGLRV